MEIIQQLMREISVNWYVMTTFSFALIFIFAGFLYSVFIYYSTNWGFVFQEERVVCLRQIGTVFFFPSLGELYSKLAVALLSISAGEIDKPLVESVILWPCYLTPTIGVYLVAKLIAKERNIKKFVQNSTFS